MNRQGWGVDLEHLEAQILKNLPLSTSHGGAFVSMYYSAQKNSGYVNGNMHYIALQVFLVHFSIFQLKKLLGKNPAI